MVPSFNLRIGATALGLGIMACSGVPEERAGATASAVIKGVVSTAEQDEVVMLMATGAAGAASCTGTLVANNVVLTAWHCVSETEPGGILCREDGTQLADGSRPRADLSPGSITVLVGATRSTRRARAKGAKIFHPTGETLCARDIAFLVLDRSIEGAKIAPMRLSTGARQGEEFVGVGWGVAQGTALPASRQQRAGLRVERVGPLAETPQDPAVPANDWGTTESACSGDSGGPALARETGAVIGVVSRGGNGNEAARTPEEACDGPSARVVYTGLHAFAGLVEAAFAEAGQTPWDESGAAPPAQAVIAGTAKDLSSEPQTEPLPLPLPLPDDPATPPIADGFDQRHTKRSVTCAAGAVGAATEVANAIAIAIAIAIAVAGRRRAQRDVAPARVRPAPSRRR